ncbi:glycosyltransferase involved in cell wall biosynthesis [Paenibacillus pabuli]|uniref:Glycosyltransferase involved in cell wall biosynthesis n=1 Tax=Paenibacillus pabuli TaxID=1472 RepID=A0ABX9BGZ9_9BACL|nr:glycosyltransferase family 1 protein [Paenibacillus pabuli]RAI92347.1 glycosyltransferase involved in cell wall biosynthesis [Paenibacillus pabuli]
MIKIYINARFLTQTITGVQRYALELVKEMDQLIDRGEIDGNRYEFCLLSPSNIINEPAFKHIRHKAVGKLKGHLWEQLELPFYAKGGLLINLCNTGPAFNKNQIVTIHDAAVFNYPKAFSFAFRAWYKFLMVRLGKTSKKIITVSHFSKGELMQHCKIAEHKLVVTHLGIDHIHRKKAAAGTIEKYGIQLPYVLAVSTMNPYKNFNLIFEVLPEIEAHNLNVVIVGSKNSKVFGEQTWAKSDAVNWVGYVSDEELKALYEDAAGFIFPSLYEGFGLPPLEAMALGCPVIVSSRASIPEVCGDAVLYFNPDSPKEAASQLIEITSNPELSKQMSYKGKDHSGLFSWNKCAKDTVNIIMNTM